jgi:limonene-1,2-epoxide hydrolase
MAVIEMFCGMGEALEFKVHHLASDGSTVLTGRTDTFTVKGKAAPCPSCAYAPVPADDATIFGKVVTLVRRQV